MRALFLVLLLIPTLPSPAARAAESYDNCAGFVDSLPAVISTQGTWCLRADLSTAITAGNAITIANNNITLDCNHFKIGGLPAGLGTVAFGVRAENRLGFRLRNCNIRGFYTGVVLSGAGHLVEGNRFEGNTVTGISLAANDSVIRDNQIVDTGGSSGFLIAAAGIGVNGEGNDVLDNSISGVTAVATDAFIYGISMKTDDAGVIGRNSVRNLVPSATGPTFGIEVDGGHPMIFENVLSGVPGNASAIGVRCTDDQASARANLITKFAVSVQGCLASGNFVNSN